MCLVLFITKVLNYVNANHFQIVTEVLILVATPIQFTVAPSRDSSAARNAKVMKYVYLTYVVTGDYATGQQSCTCAPVDDDTRRPYDSVFDTVTKTFVVFSRKQAYPAYLVSFQWSSNAHRNPRSCICGYFIVYVKGMYHIPRSLTCDVSMHAHK